MRPPVRPVLLLIASVAHALASELDTNVVLTLGAHGISFYSRNGSERFAEHTALQCPWDRRPYAPKG